MVVALFRPYFLMLLMEIASFPTAKGQPVESSCCQGERSDKRSYDQHIYKRVSCWKGSEVVRKLSYFIYVFMGCFQFSQPTYIGVVLIHLVSTSRTSLLRLLH